MIIEVYMDGIFLGWGNYNQIPAYRANGYIVAVTHFIG
jgi:hypothetical protein